MSVVSHSSSSGGKTKPIPESTSDNRHADLTELLRYAELSSKRNSNEPKNSRRKRIPDIYAPAIKDLYKVATQEQIAAILSTTQTTVSNFMKKHHIRARRGTPVNYNAIAPMIKMEYLRKTPDGKKMTLGKISKKFNISKQAVRHHLNAEGIETARR